MTLVEEDFGVGVGVGVGNLGVEAGAAVQFACPSTWNIAKLRDHGVGSRLK